MKAAEGFDIRARRMFNGMGVYTGEKMFAFLVDSDIGLKFGPDDYDEAMLLPGAEVFRADPTSDPMVGYVRMPKKVLDNHEVFVQWVHRSATYAQSKCIN
ncbi:MAG: TfoX/Sxy family protein [Armatimonadetes bacterium]|nr:TfoX/Sxy family protein [Armatimonadota bacterium]